MNQQTLAKWLKIIIGGSAICGLAIYFYFFPYYGQSLIAENPDYSLYYWPWLIFLWITAVPCYTVLYFSWEIAVEISKDNSFSIKNALLLKSISQLAVLDSVIVLAGNILYLIININHPGIILLSLIIIFIGIALAVTTAALSHLVLKAAAIRLENELTI